MHGALREIMHGGATDGRIAVAEAARPGVVAVGALEGLRGEVTILDGAARTTVADGDALIAAPPGARAALLVLAEVPAWREVVVPADVPADRVDAVVGELLTAAGVPADRATPIVIEGTFPELTWHVVDGPHTHGAPSGPAFDTPGPAVLVGFHSTRHEGVFTHMGQATHLHALVGDHTGHVDRVAIGAGARLRLPR